LKKSLDNQVVIDLVKEARCILFKEGAKKLYFRLKPKFQELGIKIGRDKFINLLKINNLLQKKKKFKQPKTDSGHPFHKHKNLIKGTTVSKPDQVYVSDITYIRVNEKWNYLTLVMDLYSRKIMGYQLSESMTVKQTSAAAIKMALKNRIGNGKTILHSDRGLQYCNPSFVNTNAKKGIVPSMTFGGDPYENAAAERLNGILKYEFGLKDHFKNHHVAKTEVDKAVNLYNKYRLHWSLGLKTPDFVYHNPQVSKPVFVNCN
jgi:transposase InsO family protein